MLPFNFHSESHASDAIAKSSTKNSQYLAGGTTLIDLMKLHVLTPAELIDLTPLPLKKITDHGHSVEVGAMATNSEMAQNPLITEHFPFVSEALLSGASVQIPNLATTSGNILQKTRCSYFRDLTAKCNRREPGQGCDALEGYNRMHAILGTSDQCIAAHPSDLSVALMAAGAEIKTNARQVSFEQFYRLPGQTPHMENILNPGELIVSISLPKTPWFKRSTYVKIRDRSSYAFALVSVAVALDIRDGIVRDSRIALGGVGTIPWRAQSAEHALWGKPLNSNTYKMAAATVVVNADTRRDNSYKVALVQQTLIRALREVERKS